jgi:hypothetical protein
MNKLRKNNNAIQETRVNSKVNSDMMNAADILEGIRQGPDAHFSVEGTPMDQNAISHSQNVTEHIQTQTQTQTNNDNNSGVGKSNGKMAMNLNTNREINFLKSNLGRAVIVDKCKHGDELPLYQFERYVKSLCAYDPNVRKVSQYFIMGTWIWIIWSCYNGIRFNAAPLKGNSVNAMFFLFEAYKDPLYPIPIFTKCQITAKSDDMIIDSLNGYLINEIIKKEPVIKNHFMEYIESCLIPLLSVSPTSNKFICPFPNIFISVDNNRTNNIFVDNFNNPTKESYGLYKASFHRAIKNRYSLKDILRLKGADFSFIFQRISKLFYAISILGKYGFSHNDAHLDNVLFDDQTLEFVLIDYGRCFFDEGLIEHFEPEERIFYERAKHNDFVVREKYDPRYMSYKRQDITELKHICTNIVEQGNNKLQYSEYISPMKNYDVIGLHNYILRPPENIKNDLFMFDIMTLTLGILNNINTNSMPNYYTIIGNQISIKTRKFIVNDMKTLGNKPDTMPIWAILLPGLFWFSLFTEFIEMTDYITLSDKDLIVTNKDRLIGPNGYLFSSFQLLNIRDSYKFDIFCKDNCMDDIEIAKNFIGISSNALNLKKSTTGGKIKKIKKNNKKSRTHKMEVKKVPKNYFKDYMGGYKGVNSNSIVNAKKTNNTEKDKVVKK